MTEKPETVSKKLKTKSALIGEVVSDSRDKTITVLVERRVKHPVYKKIIRRSTKIHAHDEDNVAHLGNQVRILTSKPISKTKHWVLETVLQEAMQLDEAKVGDK